MVKEIQINRKIRRKITYIVIVPKPLPSDLCEKISKIHGSAILQAKHTDDEERILQCVEKSEAG